MAKNEFFLQFVIFGITAATVSLLILRIFPSKIITSQKEINHVLLTPLVDMKSTDGITKDQPSKILIPALELNLEISYAKILNNQWGLYDDKVSWLTTSDKPGFGNVILYAHNRENLFGPLKKIQIGDEIEVYTQDKKFIYIVSDKRKVSPIEVDAVLSNTDRLTLYTCDGTFDQKRLIVVATPK